MDRDKLWPLCPLGKCSFQRLELHACFVLRSTLDRRWIGWEQSNNNHSMRSKNFVLSYWQNTLKISSYLLDYHPNVHIRHSAARPNLSCIVRVTLEDEMALDSIQWKSLQIHRTGRWIIGLTMGWDYYLNYSLSSPYSLVAQLRWEMIEKHRRLRTLGTNAIIEPCRSIRKYLEKVTIWRMRTKVYCT